MPSAKTVNNITCRIGIFHFFDEKGHADDYVIYNLKELSKVCDNLFLTVNGDVDKESRAKIESLGVEIIIRENKGFDFGAWKDAILSKWEIINKADELVLTNDSYYGPFVPWSIVFAKMDQEECDFWGLTSRDPYKGREGNVPEHVQSYFLTIRKTMILSPVFKNYWESLGYATSFKECVDKFEGLFTEYFSKHGYRWKIYCDVPKSSKLKNGLFEYDTDDLVIIHKLPIVKRKYLITDTGEKIHSIGGEAVMRLFDYLDSSTDYNKKMILDNIIRTCPLSVISEIIPNHMIIIDKKNKINAKSAIFFHINSTNDNQFYIECINRIPSHIDIFVVIDDSQYVDDISGDIERECSIIVSMEKDVSCISKNTFAKMKEYEFVCIIRDSETVSDQYYGIDSYPSQRSLRNCVWYNLVKDADYVDNIISTFSDNKHIGLMFPPCPDHDDYRVKNKEKWNDYTDKEKKVLKELSIDDEMICDYPDAFPLCFWCRMESINGFDERMPIQFLPIICQNNGYLPVIAITTEYAALKIKNYNIVSNTIDRMEKENTIKFFLKHSYVFKVLRKILR